MARGEPSPLLVTHRPEDGIAARLGRSTSPNTSRHLPQRLQTSPQQQPTNILKPLPSIPTNPSVCPNIPQTSPQHLTASHKHPQTSPRHPHKSLSMPKHSPIPSQHSRNILQHPQTSLQHPPTIPHPSTSPSITQYPPTPPSFPQHPQYPPRFSNISQQPQASLRSAENKPREGCPQLGTSFSHGRYSTLSLQQVAPRRPEVQPWASCGTSGTMCHIPCTLSLDSGHPQMAKSPPLAGGRTGDSK